jgi:hypothetical protein
VGQASVVGSLSVTLGDANLVASGSSVVAGQLAAVLGAVSLSAQGGGPTFSNLDRGQIGAGVLATAARIGTGQLQAAARIGSTALQAAADIGSATQGTAPRRIGSTTLRKRT